MRWLILPLCLIVGFLPFSPAQAQAGPLRGVSDTVAPTGEEALSLGRWLVRLQRDAAFGFRKLLLELKNKQSWKTVVIAAALAFVYGVLHAAGPGHGKMIVISYFLARRARLREGIWMGVRVALTHVAAALALVAILFVLFDGRPGPDLESSREIRLIAYAGMTALGLWFFIDTVEKLSQSETLHCGCHAHAPVSPADRWRTRLTGLIAGSAPCSGAMIVLLFCTANHLWLAGLLMIGAIALGMAVTMIVLGVLTLIARDRIQRWSSRAPRGNFGKLLALAGPAFVMLSGIALLILNF